jgi:hypothetical protein
MGSAAMSALKKVRAGFSHSKNEYKRTENKDDSFSQIWVGMLQREMWW